MACSIVLYCVRRMVKGEVRLKGFEEEYGRALKVVERDGSKMKEEAKKLAKKAIPVLLIGVGSDSVSSLDARIAKIAEGFLWALIWKRGKNGAVLGLACSYSSKLAAVLYVLRTAIASIAARLPNPSQEEWVRNIMRGSIPQVTIILIE